jgi:threonine dehydratase
MDAHGSAPDPQTIAQCEKLIRPYIRQTPVMEIDTAEFGLPANRLTLKLELLQHSGSFKARGAFANLLKREVPAAGVAAASGGNHGAAVAYAAMKLGKLAKIFVPTVSSPAKVARIRDYGAELAIEGDRYADALAASETWVQQTGAMPVHAFDQNETIMGQGTVGLELARQANDVDTVLVPVGGGRLIVDDAIAAAQATLWKSLRVVADPGAAAFAAIASGAYNYLIIPAFGWRPMFVIAAIGSLIVCDREFHGRAGDCGRRRSRRVQAEISR